MLNPATLASSTISITFKQKPPTPPQNSTNMQFNTILIAFLSLAASAAACTGDTHECCIGYSQDNQTIYDECCGNPADFAC
ncbi:hypothetical protein SLS57_002630 [Botryosphaeria dothidea]